MVGLLWLRLDNTDENVPVKNGMQAALKHAHTRTQMQAYKHVHKVCFVVFSTLCLWVRAIVNDVESVCMMRMCICVCEWRVCCVIAWARGYMTSPCEIIKSKKITEPMFPPCWHLREDILLTYCTRRRAFLQSDLCGWFRASVHIAHAMYLLSYTLSMFSLMRLYAVPAERAILIKERASGAYQYVSYSLIFSKPPLERDSVGSHFLL